MPSVSQAQAKLMAACSHGADFKNCPPQSVAEEFNQADKGHSIKSLPKHKKERSKLAQAMSDK